MPRITFGPLAALTLITLGAPGSFAASPADGAYVGVSRHVSGPEGNCAKDFKYTANVVNGSFDYMWVKAENIQITLTVAADGTVSGSRTIARSGQIVGSGKLTGNKMELDIKSGACARHLSLTKSG